MTPLEILKKSFETAINYYYIIDIFDKIKNNDFTEINNKINFYNSSSEQFHTEFYLAYRIKCETEQCYYMILYCILSREDIVCVKNSLITKNFIHYEGLFFKFCIKMIQGGKLSDCTDTLLKMINTCFTTALTYQYTSVTFEEVKNHWENILKYYKYCEVQSDNFKKLLEK